MELLPRSGARLPIAAIALAVSLLSARHGRAEVEEPEGGRPNILFVAIDDLNDWTGFLGGHPQARTPHLDRFAASGMVFTRAHCAAPACNPSRVSLLTGLRPSTSGVYYNGDPWRAALPRAVTLPQHFMEHGYHAAGAGKIFHGRFRDRASWHDYMPQPRDPMPEGRPLNGIRRTAHFDWGPVTVPPSAMGDHAVVDRALRFLEEGHERPFFLAAGIYRPHLPWYVPQEFFDRFPLEEVRLPEVREDDLADVPPAGRKVARPEGDHRNVVASGNWRRAVQAYLASIAFADAEVGRLLQGLERSRYAANTIVVIWSDHGWHLGEKEHWRKFTLWEEATRVVLMISAPGVTRPGTRSERVVSLLDVYPTLVELAGLPPRPELEGRSLVPLLRDPQAPWDRPALTTHGRGNHAVRSERWRFIRYADGSEELYDHEADPREWTNLAGRPEMRGTIEDLAKWLPATDAAPVERGKRAAAGGGRSEGRTPEGAH